MHKVSVFLNQCLPLSEIFVYHQASALTRYDVEFLACKTVSASVDHDIPVFAINKNTLQGKLAELVFKATGVNPSVRKKVRDSDLVHAHFGPTGWIASRVTQKENKPLIVTFHGFDVSKRAITAARDGKLQAFFAKNRKKLAERADLFICVSNFLKDRAVEFGFPEEKCIVHYMGIPLTPHKVPKRERNEGDVIRILSVGRLVPVKGHTKLLQAIALLEKDGLDVQLDIIGDGILRESLEQQAKDSLKNCTFHGAIPHEQVLHMMRQSDIFCHTSMTQENGQAEALGLVVCEAQWAGLPVVAFASGGVPEALDEGNTGFLCREGSVPDLYDKIKNIIKNPKLMSVMSEAGPKFIKEKFCGVRQTAELEDIYDMVIKNHK